MPAHPELRVPEFLSHAGIATGGLLAIMTGVPGRLLPSDRERSASSALSGPNDSSRPSMQRNGRSPRQRLRTVRPPAHASAGSPDASRCRSDTARRASPLSLESFKPLGISGHACDKLLYRPTERSMNSRKCGTLSAETSMTPRSKNGGPNLSPRRSATSAGFPHSCGQRTRRCGPRGARAARLRRQHAPGASARAAFRPRQRRDAERTYGRTD